MTPDLLSRIAARIEETEKRLEKNPGDRRAAAFRDCLLDLEHYLSKLPDDHRLFREWERTRWEPVALADH